MACSRLSKRRWHNIATSPLPNPPPRRRNGVAREGIGALISWGAERTGWLTSEKLFRVLRFTNRAVMQNLEGVLDAIRAALDEHGDRPSP
ncbi:MAG: DUF559 domain-containing protein [Chloroflexi bacterium]|nr:DUF559 domain-containing protein [Chloroflexota bacterium]